MYQTTSEYPSSRERELERRNSLMWRLTALLLAVQGIALAAFYLAQVRGNQSNWDFFPEQRILLAVGLCGLSILFGLVMLRKQLGLRRLHREHLNTRIHDEALRGHLSELSSLFEAALETNLQLDLDGILQTVTRRVLTCLDADHSSVMLVDDETGDLHCLAATGVDEKLVRGSQVKMGQGVSGWVAENNEVLLLDQDEMTRRFPAEVKVDRSITSAVCAPLVIHETAVGVLNVNRLAGKPLFTKSEAGLLAMFARHIAVAIQRNREFCNLNLQALSLVEDNSRLERGNQELRELDKTRQRLLESANHELRAPLMSIINCAQALAQGGSAQGTEQLSTLARILEERASQLLQSANDLVDLSFLHQGFLRKDSSLVYLNHVVEGCLQAIQHDAGRRGIVVEKSLDGEDVLIRIDERKVSRVLVNLITALIRSESIEQYRGRTIHVSTRADGDGVVVAITDSGTETGHQRAGLPLSAEESVNQPTDSSYRGISLAVELARRVAKAHGGRFWIERGIRGGSHFCMHLPAAQVIPVKEKALPKGSPRDLEHEAA